MRIPKILANKAAAGLKDVLESIHAHLELQLETQDKILFELQRTSYGEDVALRLKNERDRAKDNQGSEKDNLASE